MSPDNNKSKSIETTSEVPCDFHLIIFTESIVAITTF